MMPNMSFSPSTPTFQDTSLAVQPTNPVVLQLPNLLTLQPSSLPALSGLRAFQPNPPTFKPSPALQPPAIQLSFSSLFQLLSSLFQPVPAFSSRSSLFQPFQPSNLRTFQPPAFQPPAFSLQQPSRILVCRPSGLRFPRDSKTH